MILYKNVYTLCSLFMGICLTLGPLSLRASSGNYSQNITFDKAMSDTSKQKVLRHLVNFKFKDEVSQEQIDDIVKAFIDLQNKIPEIIGFEWGINNSQEGNSKGFTHSFVLTYKNEADRDVYLVHKDHLAFVKKVGPVLADVFVMDYWTKKSF